MTKAYGLRRRMREAVILLCCVLFTSVAGAEPAKVLVLGDSLTAGYGLPAPDAFQAQLTAALKGRAALVDGAVSGDTTAGGLARLDWALGDGAEVAIVELGANDGLRGLDPKTTEANLAAILDMLAARKIVVVLAGMLAPPNLGEEYGREFAAVYQRLAQRSGVIFQPFFLDGVAGNPALNQADRIHPNPEGVKIVVAKILPYIERALAEAGK